MKKIVYITIVTALLAAAQVFAAEITKVNLSYENGATIARVTVQGSYQISHQTEIPKNGKGDRMILDVIGAVNNMSVKSFTELPPCLVKAIRTSQYSVTPEKVARLVFDLSKAPVYQVASEGNTIKITFTDKAATSFTSWSSDQVKTPVQVVPENKVTPPVATLNVPAAPVSTVKSVPEKPKPTEVVAQAPKTNPVETKTSTPSVVNATPKVVATTEAPKPQVVTVPKPVPTSDKPLVVETKAQPATSLAKSPVVAANEVKPTVSTPVAQPAKVEKVPSAPVVEQKPLVVVQTKPAPTTVTAPSEKKNETPIVALSPKPVVPSVVEQKVPAVVQAKPAPAVVTVPSEKKNESPVVALSPKPVVPTVVEQKVPTVVQAKPVQPSLPQAEKKNDSPFAQAGEVKSVPTTSPAPVTKKEEEKPVPPANKLPVIPATTAKPEVVLAKDATPTPEKMSEKPLVENNKPIPVVKELVPPVQASQQKPVAVVVQTEPAKKPIEKQALVSEKPDEKKLAPAQAGPSVGSSNEKQLSEAESDQETSNTAVDERSTARFRRAPAATAKIKGTLVAEFPERLVVKYEQSGNRDPFATLIDNTRTTDSPIKNKIPNIEGLRLVGILESIKSDSENRALFEDKNGYSYMLSSGDKVQKGYVLRVEANRVYFQIFEYGWSRTVALEIENGQ